jgi:hypothetical protein
LTVATYLIDCSEANSKLPEVSGNSVRLTKECDSRMRA